MSSIFSVRKIGVDIQNLNLHKRILKLFIECYTSFAIHRVYKKNGNKQKDTYNILYTCDIYYIYIYELHHENNKLCIIIIGYVNMETIQIFRV